MSGDSFTEWAVRYPAEHCADGYGYQLCDDEDHAIDWVARRYLSLPCCVVHRTVTRSAWVSEPDPAGGTSNA